MAKARITLNDNGPLSYHGNGYDIQQGQAIVTSKDEDIIYFSAPSGFTIDMLEGEKPKAVSEASEPDDDDDDDGHGAAGAVDPDGPVDGELSETDLMKHNKGPLLELATERGVKADASMNKKEIVAAILAAKES